MTSLENLQALKWKKREMTPFQMTEHWGNILGYTTQYSPLSISLQRNVPTLRNLTTSQSYFNLEDTEVGPYMYLNYDQAKDELICRMNTLNGFKVSLIKL